MLFPICYSIPLVAIRTLRNTNFAITLVLATVIHLRFTSYYMIERSRSYILRDIAYDTHYATFKNPEIKGLGPYDGMHDVKEFAVDPSQPIVALYNSHQFEGAAFLAIAAARMRRRGQDAANFVVIPDGLYAERIIETDDGNALGVDAGYTYDHAGNVYIFDQPKDPLIATMADTSMSGGFAHPTMKHLNEASIPLLRPKEYFAYDDKAVLKERLYEAGIPTPLSLTIDLENLANLTAETAPERFVIKPRGSIQGESVTLFNEGFDQQKLDAAVNNLRATGRENVIIEDFIESIPLRRSEVEGPASFNLRVIIYNEFCGAFARVHPEGMPGNVALGASTLSLKKLKQSLYHQQGLEPDALQASLNHISRQIGEAFPNCMIGADIMIDTNGDPQVVELNFNDFGAFDRSAFSLKDWMQALETAVEKITVVANSQPQPPTREDATAEYSVVDFSEYSTTLLRYADRRPYYTDDDEFRPAKFKRDYYPLMRQNFDSLEVRRQGGDKQQVITGYDVLRHFTGLSEAKRLHKKVDDALSKIAIANHGIRNEAENSEE